MIRFIVTFCLLSILVDSLFTNFTVEEQLVCNIRKDWKYWARYMVIDGETKKPLDTALDTAWEYVNGNSRGPRRHREFSIDRETREDHLHDTDMIVTHTCTTTGQEITKSYVHFIQLTIRATHLDPVGIVLDTECNELGQCWHYRGDRKIFN